MKPCSSHSPSPSPSWLTFFEGQNNNTLFFSLTGSMHSSSKPSESPRTLPPPLSGPPLWPVLVLTVLLSLWPVLVLTVLLSSLVSNDTKPVLLLLTLFPLLTAAASSLLDPTRSRGGFVVTKDWPRQRSKTNSSRPICAPELVLSEYWASTELVLSQYWASTEIVQG